MKRTLKFIVAWLVFISACTSPRSSEAQGTSKSPSHETWTTLLTKHVDDEGFVDYQGMIKDKVQLNLYTQLLSDNSPAESWSEAERLAYWINAYNAFTVKLIVDNYPLESIKDLNPVLSIPTVRSIWTKEWFQIGGADMSLDQIEHKIIRKEFEEPRIHFAVNCASFSCPPLRAEAYTATKLDLQLEEQAKLFINDAVRNEIAENSIKVSKIFNWFGGDFKKGQTLIEFINKYSDVKVDDNAKIRFMSYDWSLNDQARSK